LGRITLGQTKPGRRDRQRGPLALTELLQPLATAPHLFLTLGLIEGGITGEGFPKGAEGCLIGPPKMFSLLQAFPRQKGAEGLPSALKIAEATIRLQLQRLLQGGHPAQLIAVQST
jgi:hypothetical protein